MNKQSGIALILVLMLSVLLSVIGIGFQYHANRVVERVKMQQTKTELKVLLENEKQNLLFDFLTSDTLFKNPYLQNQYRLQEHDADVKISVVSNDSKLSLFDINRERMRAVMSTFFVMPSDIDKAVDSYFDWVDVDDLRRPNGWEQNEYRRNGQVGPKNSPLSSIDELLQINGFGELSIQQLSNVFTLYPVFDLDKAYAHPNLLSVFFSDDIVARLVESRTLSGYSRQDYMRITGDAVNYVNSSGTFYLTITLVVSKNGIVEKQVIDVKIAPYHPIPLQIFRVE